jgi:hypothetical protein
LRYFGKFGIRITLPPTVHKFEKSGNVGVGSLVLIREDNVPRMQWPLGLVTKEFPGKDGFTRSVEVNCQGDFCAVSPTSS